MVNLSKMADLQKLVALQLGLRGLKLPGQAGPTKSALRRLDDQPRRIVSVDTTSDPRYASRAARGHGVSRGWYEPRRSPRACRPIAGQERTSVQFRYLRRHGFEIKADKGIIYAVPLASVWGPKVGRTAIGRLAA